MKQGFSLIEILLALALLAIFVVALARVLSFSVFTVEQGESFSKSYSLAQEQLEAILNLKNTGGPEWNWTATPDNTNVGEYYQPSFNGSQWTLGPKKNNPITLTNDFVKYVEIIPVTAWGPDPNRREIISTVKWLERGQAQQVRLNLLVTRI